MLGLEIATIRDSQHFTDILTEAILHSKLKYERARERERERET